MRRKWSNPICMPMAMGEPIWTGAGAGVDRREPRPSADRAAPDEREGDGHHSTNSRCSRPIRTSRAMAGFLTLTSTVRVRSNSGGIHMKIACLTVSQDG